MPYAIKIAFKNLIEALRLGLYIMSPWGLRRDLDQLIDELRAIVQVARETDITLTRMTDFMREFGEGI